MMRVGVLQSVQVTTALLTALVILGGLAGAVLWAHWIAPADGVRTVIMTAVAVALSS